MTRERLSGWLPPDGRGGYRGGRVLAQRGIPVTVLEARDRVGGRCYTSEGVDYGAHWIHGTEGNPITNLARELGIGTLFVGGDSAYSGGWDQLVLHGPDGKTALALDDQRFHRFLLAFPESALALLRLTVERLIAQRGERRPKRTSV